MNASNKCAYSTNSLHWHDFHTWILYLLSYCSHTQTLPSIYIIHARTLINANVRDDCMRLQTRNMQYVRCVQSFLDRLKCMRTHKMSNDNGSNQCFMEKKTLHLHYNKIDSVHCTRNHAEQSRARSVVTNSLYEYEVSCDRLSYFIDVIW